MKLQSVNNLENKKQRFFVRVDYNVPLKNGVIVNDFKIKQSLKTIDYILSHGGKVILATHLGRPKLETNNHVDPSLSTKIIQEWLEKTGYTVDYEPDLLKAKMRSYEHPSHLLLLENLRFFKGEKARDKDFANLLADLADSYVNEAFSMIHRIDTSMVLLPEQFLPECRSIGFNVETELAGLAQLKESPKQPFLLILGGIKAKEKLSLLENIMIKSEKNRPNKIMIGGGLAQAFFRAQGINAGIKIIDDEAIENARQLIAHYKNSILLPTDALVKHDNAFKTCLITEIPDNAQFVDIGPLTIAAFTQKIKHAQSIFSGGTMGMYETDGCQNGTRSVIEAITTNNSAYSVVGGGDAVAAAQIFDYHNNINFLSTGGGATLAYLGVEDDKDLPSLKILRQS